MKKSVIALILSIVMMVGSVSGSPVHAAETTAQEANEPAQEAIELTQETNGLAQQASELASEEEAEESEVPEENEDADIDVVSEAPSEETESVPEEEINDVQDPNPSEGSLEGNTAAESLTEESPENEAAATTEETGTAAENEAAETIEEAGTTVENEATATTKETGTAATNAPAQPSEMMEIVDSGHLTDESGKEAKLAASGSLLVDDILSREIIPTDVSSASSDCVLVGVPGEYIAEQDTALARINEIRWEACEEGVKNPNTGQPLTTDDYVPLKWSKDMEYIARIRAAEAAFTGDHIRASGKSIWTTTGPDGNRATFEDLAWNWSDTMITGIEQWYSEKRYWVNNTPYAETGHYTSMINPSCRYVGLGTFCTEGVDYYNTTAGEFSTRSGLDESHMSFTGECVQMVEMIYSHLSSEGEIIGALRAVPGEKSSHLLALEANYWFGLTNVYLMSGVTWNSSDESIVTISADGEATAVSGGSAIITAYFEEGNISGEAEFVIKGVQDPDSEKCGDNATWAVTGEGDDLTLTISGTGKMYDFWDKYEMETSTPWASYADDIRTVVIEDGITSIGDCAFQGCVMTSIIIPDSVTSIGDTAFQYCSNVSSISIPEGVTSIGNSAFESCYDLTDISIPESVTSIGDSAFENCYDLAEFSIPDNVTSIGSRAFYCCESLTDISIPDSVTSIGDSAFQYCTGITSIAVPEGVTRICNSVFESCYALTDISIPDSVTSIGDNAFYYCESLTKISIPDSVTSIGECAFYRCSSLTDVKIPNGLEKIEDMTFYGCSGITEFTIPGSVTEIGESAFGECSSAKSIILPDSVTYINEYAFGYCSNLETISLPANIQAIEKGTFRSCSSLTEITIPDGVERIGYYVFFYCDNLKSIMIPDSVTVIDDYAFSNDTNLTDVNYGGSESDWNAVTIGRLNDPLLNAAIHFNSGANGHTHSWNTDYTVDQEPTCQTEGSESIHCLTCGAIKKTTVRAIPMKEHNYGEWTVSKEATCTESGSREKTCADCGNRVTEEIPTAGHTWGEDYTIDRMATCTEEGSKSIHCTICGSINETTVQTIPAKEHNYSDWSIIAEASCTEDGRRERVCADCGDIDSEEIPAAGHIWNKEYTVDKEPTYMNTGSKSIHCSICDAVRDGSTVAIPILQRDIGEVTITGIENKTYTGQEITQNPRITDGTRILSQGIDYTLSFRNNMTPGTATMTITGIGRYTGTVIKTFMILPGKTTRGDMFNLAGNVKVTWKEVPGAKYYKIYREGITDNKESREEPVIVTERLIGWDQQPGLTNGHAYRYRIVSSLTGKGDSSGDSPLSYSKLMYRLKTVVIRSVKNTAPGKVTVKYDKTTSGDSYVLQYCERQDMVGAKTKVVLGASNTSYVIGGLKKGKTYYISIRVRKKVDGIDYYTTFGVPKKVTITK